MKWFKHSASSNVDAKLQDLALEYGFEGYGVYWYCLELIAGNVEPENLTFELEHDARLIARYGGIGVQKVEEIMKYMIKLELFECSNGRITCLKLAKRADDYTSKVVRSNRPQVLDNKELRQTPTNSDKVPLEENRIDKNRIDQKRESRGRFTPPTLEEISAHIKQKNYQVDPHKFLAHYEANGWYRGKTKIKCWKSCLAYWNRTDQNKSGGISDADFDDTNW